MNTETTIEGLELAARRTRAEANKLEAEAEKLEAEKHKLRAEKAKLQRDATLWPLLAAGFVGSFGTIAVALILHLLGLKA